MTIKIQRNETSQPIVYTEVINAYTKGPMYCVMFLKDNKRTTHKYPLISLFRVVEDYNETERTSNDIIKELDNVLPEDKPAPTIEDMNNAIKSINEYQQERRDALNKE